MWGPGPPQGQASDEGDPPGGPSGVPAAAAAAAAAVPAVDDLGGLDPALEADAVRQAAAGMLLPFQRALLEELLEEDGLCVLSPGLGLHQVVAALLRLQDARLHAPGQRGVVLVLGAAPWQRDLLRRELLRIDPAIAERAAAAIGARAAAALEVPAEVTNEVAAAERQALYATRSCLFVTTRILVVDQLSGRISADQIAGMVVLNAHRVTDSSGEGFAVRLYKSAAPAGVVRAFSDAPAAFASEFNKVEKVMKALYVRRLYLWPRFQAQAREDLEARPPQLLELAQPMSAAMSLIYESIAELMGECVRELKRINNKLDATDLTVNQSLTRAFDEAVRRQLAPIWHTVSPKTKQIVADLRTLRSLASFMLRFDSVTFMSYLDNLRATEGTKSVWLFHSAAHTIFEAAKSRVYKLKQAGGGAAAAAQKRKRRAGEGEDAAGGGGGGGGARAAAPAVEPVLEVMPKWELLREVLEEIQAERAKLRHQAGVSGSADTSSGRQAAAGAAAPAAGDDEVIVLDSDGEDKQQDPEQDPAGERGAGPGEPPAAAAAQQAAQAPVLVVCQDAFTKRQLRDVLKAGGPEALMQRLYRDYLQYKLEGGAAGSRKAGGALADEPSGGAAGSPGSGGGGPPQARMMGGYRPGEETALLKEARALAAAAGGGAQGGGAQGDSAGSEGEGSDTSLQEPRGGGGGAAADVGAPGGAGGDPQQQRQQQQQQHPLLEGVRFLSLESREYLALWEAEPAFVVMYDLDVAFTRCLELYKAARPGRPLAVYLLRYEDSFESDRYQLALRREREVFESMIKNKEIMILPIATSREQVDPARCLPATHADEALLLGGAANALTRRAGGRASSRPVPKRVVVDVREFMSSLPAVLHQQGLEVVPLTLEVGDYVLSPELCVERKSISDLKGSLASGRLYHQAAAMSKHYKTPVLLIEFEGDRAFALQASSDIGDEVQLHSLMSRVALLVLHFPRLRLIWSRSLHATADIFQQLKANQDEPDPVTAATVGVPDEAGACAGGAPIESLVNQTAIDLLRRLPGVTEGNYRALMREAGSLAGLADLSLATLTAVVGGQTAARKLKEFLSQECRALFAAL
ncbi:DNA repair endonuclease UVH1 [Micractinium conductrix]|uniref:DNA repair endonuclease UVH1 n=1 Tax=Micractinium conductrix TaxID=554055 RepID=A0A2P6VME9_9CHLO|nr:DNA repair endonuclease UVH1 [Micractinium conductrix]|eukprot:PSC75286.1 DNA repair endonuclease UVH1 [Micractinium conductrix]